MKKSIGIILALAIAAISLQAMGVESPKVQDIKGSTTTLWMFIFKMWGSLEFQIFYAMVLGGLLGTFANYAIKWLRDEIAGDLYTYLFVSNPKRTILSFVLATASGLTGIAAGAFETPAGDFVGWGNVLWIAVMNGWSFDSAANKGSREVWTPDERAAAAKAPPQPDPTRSP